MHAHALVLLAWFFCTYRLQSLELAAHLCESTGFEQHKREGNTSCRQEDRQHTAIAYLLILKGGNVHLQWEDSRREAGATLRHHPDQVKVSQSAGQDQDR